MIKQILDKLLLLLIGTVLLTRQEITAETVVIWLLCLCLASLCLYYDKRQIVAGLLIVYGVLCLCLPGLLVFLPVLCYDAFRNRCWWCFAYALLAVPWWDRYPADIWVVVGIGLLAASLLAYSTQRSQELSASLIRLRDTATERDMLLRERNKELLEKQEYEIYIATLKERNRIAREIHDNVGHMLSRSILQVGALGTVHKEEPLHAQLLSVNDTLNAAMTSIRQSVHDLHDEAIDLEQAVRECVREMEENYSISIEYDMSREVPRKVKYCFITIVKEAMNNIVKHSNADKVTVILREHPGLYQLSVEDNGSVSRGDGEGIGLVNMRERVQALGGTLHIRREQGFHIFVSIQKREDMTCGS